MKYFWKAVTVIAFTHAVAYAYGQVTGVKSAWESMEKQQRVMERYLGKASRAPRP